MSKKILYILIISAIFTTQLFSQDLANPLSPSGKTSPFFTGPVAGVSSVNHNTDVNTTFDLPGGISPDCPKFTTGSAIGYYFGWTAEYQIGGTKNSYSSIIGKLVYNNLNTSMNQEGPGFPITLADGSLDITRVEYVNDVSYSSISLDIFYKFNFAAGLGVVVGPTFGYNLNATESVRMNLLSPDVAQFNRVDVGELPEGASYANGDRTLIINEDAEFDGGASAVRVGLMGGLQYEILMRGYYIVPHVMYNLGFTNLRTDDINWTVSAIQFGVDVRFSAKTLFR